MANRAGVAAPFENRSPAGPVQGRFGTKTRGPLDGPVHLPDLS